MNNGNKKTKITKLFKKSFFEPSELSQAWSENRPLRYEDSEIGLDTWITDIDRMSGNQISDDEKINILKGKVDSTILEKIGDWNNFLEVVPRSAEVKKTWVSKNLGQSFFDFKKFFEENKIDNLQSAKEKIKISDYLPKEKEIFPQIGEKSKEMDTSFFESIKEKVFGKDPKKDIFSEEDKNITSYSNDDDFYHKVLDGLGAPITKNNMLFFYAWRQSEGGRASYNPFNTTMTADGATNYNHVGVKNYVSREQGILSTIKTLKLGYYTEIVDCLRRSADPKETAQALKNSPWGTGALALKVIDGYNQGAKPRPSTIAVG